MKLDLTKIIQERLASTQYIHEITPKKQIYLHHTAGNGDPQGVARYWNRNKERIGTAFIIGELGTIVQCFSSKHWGYHLGCKMGIFAEHGVTYQDLNRISVGIEVCNWGYLVQKGDKYFNYIGKAVDTHMVTTLDAPFKGHKHWYKYTDEQIESLRQLLVYLGETYDIPLKYYDDIWAISKEALSGEAGVFTHNSVRRDKSDMYPCPRVIAMLKTL